MKKSSFFLIILMSFMTIGVFHYNSHQSTNFSKQPVYENTDGYSKYPRVGDLYIIRNKETLKPTFFRIAGNPSQDNVYILKGQQTEAIPNEQDFDRLFQLMTFYDNYHPNLEVLSKKDLLALNNNATSSLKIYRQAQKLPVSYSSLYYNSPIGFFGTFLGLFFLLLGLKTTLFTTKHPFSRLNNQYLIYISTAITTILFIGFYSLGKTFLYSWGLVLGFYVLSIVPITYVFNYTNQRFFSKLDFLDREINKFFCILIIGFLFQVWGFTLLKGIYKAFDLTFLNNFYYHELLGLPAATLTAFLSWFLIASLNFLYNTNQHFSNYQEKVKALDQAKINELQSQAELDALHAKVNPHFLYNSLNSIAGLAQEDPNKTEEMAIALSHFYKYSTNRQTENWSRIEEEIEILETYLDIEKIRFGHRLQYQISCPEALKLKRIPRFLLQPLVENAIKYGYQSDTNSIDIKVLISEEENGEISLQIFDGGQPFPENLPSGYGVQSVRKKLELLLPDEHELAFINQPNKHVAIVLY